MAALGHGDAQLRGISQEGDGLQIGAVIEGRIADPGNAGRNHNAAQLLVVGKGLLRQMGHNCRIDLGRDLHIQILRILIRGRKTIDGECAVLQYGVRE